VCHDLSDPKFNICNYGNHHRNIPSQFFTQSLLRPYSRSRLLLTICYPLSWYPMLSAGVPAFACVDSRPSWDLNERNASRRVICLRITSLLCFLWAGLDEPSGSRLTARAGRTPFCRVE
jgi:hypothetical protein